MPSRASLSDDWSFGICSFVALSVSVNLRKILLSPKPSLLLREITSDSLANVLCNIIMLTVIYQGTMVRAGGEECELRSEEGAIPEAEMETCEAA